MYISDKTRFRQRRGQGEGVKYIPWIFTRDLSSKGTCFNPIDWRTGRTCELLSLLEYNAWTLLNWKVSTMEIREQFPLLPIEATRNIADEYGIKHPRNKYGESVLTTDLLVFQRINNNILSHAYSIKYDCDLKEKDNSERTVEKLFIEKTYWNRKGIDFSIITEKNINHQKAINIRNVMQFRNYNDVKNSNINTIKYLIANRIISVDLCQKINYKQIMDTLKIGD